MTFQDRTTIQDWWRKDDLGCNYVKARHTAYPGADVLLLFLLIHHLLVNFFIDRLMLIASAPQQSSSKVYDRQQDTNCWRRHSWRLPPFYHWITFHDTWNVKYARRMWLPTLSPLGQKSRALILWSWFSQVHKNYGYVNCQDVIAQFLIHMPLQSIPTAFFISLGEAPWRISLFLR